MSMVSTVDAALPAVRSVSTALDRSPARRPASRPTGAAGAGAARSAALGAAAVDRVV